MKKISTILFFFSLLIFSSSVSAQTDTYFLGTWEVTVKDTPNGTVNVVLNIERVDGKLAGKFIDPNTNSETPIPQINEGEKSITLYFFAEGYDLILNLKPVDEDNLSGMLMDSFAVSGTRVK
jgi:hypothetical protein